MQWFLSKIYERPFKGIVTNAAVLQGVYTILIGVPDSLVRPVDCILFHSLRILGVYKKEHYMSFGPYLHRFQCASKENNKNNYTLGSNII